LLNLLPKVIEDLKSLLKHEARSAVKTHFVVKFNGYRMKLRRRKKKTLIVMLFG